MREYLIDKAQGVLVGIQMEQRRCHSLSLITDAWSEFDYTTPTALVIGMGLFIKETVKT